MSNFVERFIAYLIRVIKILSQSSRTKGIVRLKFVPSGLQEIKEYYGDAEGTIENCDPLFFRENIVKVDLPFTLRDAYNKRPITSIVGHYLVVPAVIDALKEIVNYKGFDWLRENNYDLFGGMFVYRVMRGSNYLSTHSWGIAVDYCPHLGRYGYVEDIKTYPQFIVDAFKKRGFDWGGDWYPAYEPDAMHFQACVNY